MSEPMPGGRRRVDKVLGEGFLDGLTGMPLQELRERRHEAEQENADLSYIRRLLQGRMDIIKAERTRRGSGASEGGVVDQLSTVLADGPRPTPYGLGQYLNVEPSRVAEHRRRVEQLVSDPALSDVAAMTDAQLEAGLEELSQFERMVSGVRKRVQAVVDQLTAEVARRYRDGQAQVDDLLHSDRD